MFFICTQVCGFVVRILVISNINYTNFSWLGSLFLVIKILLEDLWIFVNEVSETIANCVSVILVSLFTLLDHISIIIGDITNSVLTTVDSLVGFIHLGINTVIFTAQKCNEIFSLVGHSLILLIKLVPRTFYLVYLSCIQLSKISKETAVSGVNELYLTAMGLSKEMMLGVLFSIVFGSVGVKFTLRTIRERNITLSSVIRVTVWLLVQTYIKIFESIARSLRMTVRLMEMMVNNLRMPMFAHAGDSEDEDEDRENLVGEVGDSDDEENERIETRRRNYVLLRQRAESRKGAGVEEELLREVEREREDKLCCICTDREKCIMMLPCRHLCICERCMTLLKNHGNSCPMCRKPVKQMIKAYL